MFYRDLFKMCVSVAALCGTVIVYSGFDDRDPYDFETNVRESEILQNGFRALKEEVKKKFFSSPLNEKEEAYRFHVLGEINDKVVDDEKTLEKEEAGDDNEKKDENKPFSDLSEGDADEIYNPSPYESIHEDTPVDSNLQTKFDILTYLLKIGHHANDNLIIVAVAGGALLAVLFPQETKSVFSGTAAKIKNICVRLKQKACALCCFRKKCMVKQETV